MYTPRRPCAEAQGPGRGVYADQDVKRRGGLLRGGPPCGTLVVVENGAARFGQL